MESELIIPGGAEQLATDTAFAADPGGTADATTRRSIPRFSAAVRSLSRLSSSRKITSSTQCRPFSIPQCPRVALPNSSALPRRLQM